MEEGHKCQARKLKTASDAVGVEAVIRQADWARRCLSFTCSGALDGAWEVLLKVE